MYADRSIQPNEKPPHFMWRQINYKESEYSLGFSDPRDHNPLHSLASAIGFSRITTIQAFLQDGQSGPTRDNLHERRHPQIARFPALKET